MTRAGQTSASFGLRAPVTKLEALRSTPAVLPTLAFDFAGQRN